MSHIFPSYSRSELIADGAVHVLGVTLGLIGASVLIALAATQLDPAAAIAVLVYGAGMLAVFCFSAAYNLNRGPRRWLLRRLDHAAIYVKIAATYTPFAAIKMGGGAGSLLLAIVWGIAVFGVAAKLIAPAQLVRTSYVLYLAQGWAGVLAFGPMLEALSGTALTLLLAGGVLYTVGVVFHLWEKLPYNNAIWHGCVLTASGCHFAAVLDAVVLG
ncbi:MAG: hemolysin III family protein [Hyphomicrobium sp.]|nr:hemolysin III family protein [Hyphomicrobium sp.]